MSKQFYFTFGSGSPASYSGLSPSLTVFLQNGITALIGPTLLELSAGTGIYGFQYGTTASIVFVIDGGIALAATPSIRYITGSIDPIVAVDQMIGYPTDSYGSTAVDPATLFGQAKRNQEVNEGAKVFVKSTGLLDVYSRGSSALLFEKTVANTTTSATTSP